MAWTWLCRWCSTHRVVADDDLALEVDGAGRKGAVDVGRLAGLGPAQASDGGLTARVGRRCCVCARVRVGGVGEMHYRTERCSRGVPAGRTQGRALGGQKLDK
jgi:hypothetical protein